MSTSFIQYLLHLLFNLLKLRSAWSWILWVLQIWFHFVLSREPFHFSIKFQLFFTWKLLFRRDYCFWNRDFTIRFLFFVYHWADFLELRLRNEASFENCVFENAFNNSIFGHKLEAFRSQSGVNNPALLFRVIIGTRSLPTILILTLISFIEHGMIGLLLPAMTHITRSTMLTACQVVIDHILGLPIDTRYWLIRVHRRIPPVVLPIVRIYAFVLFMLCQVEDAELGLVVKHVKVLILEIVVN